MKNNLINTYKPNAVDASTDKITKALSKYTERIVNEDKSVTYTEISTNYFLENDKWHIDFFGNIEQFKEQVNNYKYTNKNISFPFNNPNINKEVKFIVYNKLFSDEWGLQATLVGQMQFIRQLAEFINEKHPNINSIIDLDIEKSNFQWIDWLSNNGIKTIQKNNRDSKLSGKECFMTTPSANFLIYIISSFKELIDER